MKNILFPTDFSPSAHKAFEYAIELAKITNAKVDVINVYPEPLKGKDLYLGPEKLRPLRKEKQKEMEEKMADFVKQYSYKNIDDMVVFPSDSPADSIISRSKRNYDLVVMGTKGERNAMNKILGSVTTKTMFNGGCPVLAIPENAEFKGIKQITYATSLNANDKHFLKQLSRFAKTIEAAIQFLHISDKPKFKAEEQLKIKKTAIEFTEFHVVNNSSVMEGIEEFLNENHSDLLALFIPKRKLWDRLFHKSISKKLTYHASIPLFVFHN